MAEVNRGTVTTPQRRDNPSVGRLPNAEVYRPISGQPLTVIPNFIAELTNLSLDDDQWGQAVPQPECSSLSLSTERTFLPHQNKMEKAGHLFGGDQKARGIENNFLDREMGLHTYMGKVEAIRGFQEYEKTIFLVKQKEQTGPVTKGTTVEGQ